MAPRPKHKLTDSERNTSLHIGNGYTYKVVNNPQTLQSDTIDVQTVTPRGRTYIDNLSNPTREGSYYTQPRLWTEPGYGSWYVESPPQEWYSQESLLKSRDAVRNLINKDEKGDKLPENHYKNMPSNVDQDERGQVVIKEPYWIQRNSTITVGPGEHSEEMDVWPLAVGRVTNAQGQPMLVQVPDTVTGPQLLRPIVHAGRKVKYALTSKHKQGGLLMRKGGRVVEVPLN